ncbi:ArsR/SmtB family transcription factor [Streptomyces davaonensis]|uniref:ArsR/SmtB family transcription factor n=1 Tax=Streptomyces davaonensis TaxID=348043 RepID=UPI00034DC191|nr:winged helix-turn-helix domain-containing protein [Streptomyces davaonensis]
MSTDFDTGLDALLHTPKTFLRGDMEAFTRITGRTLPAWAGDLADGSPRALETVDQAVRDWHRVAIAPMQEHLHARVEAARASAARALLAEGLDAMLSRLHPTISWSSPVLEVFSPDYDEDVHLEGRGLRLIPSLFCGRRPALLLTSQPPVVMFPVPHDTVWIPEPDRVGEPRPGTLEALLGRSRALTLRLITIGHGVTTTDLARRTGVSAATVSHHTTVLRDAGLITTHRAGPHAHHLPTPLGSRLVHNGHA